MDTSNCKKTEEQIGGRQGWDGEREVGIMGEGGQRVQTSHL